MEKPVRKSESDVTDDAFYKAKSGMRPTEKTLRDHDDVVNMVRNIGFTVTESPGNLGFRFPSDYRVRHYRGANRDLPDRVSFMRGLALMNEILDRHFFIYPDDRKLDVRIETNGGHPLVSYRIDRTEWDRVRENHSASYASMTGEGSGILHDMKVSPLIMKIQKDN